MNKPTKKHIYINIYESKLTGARWTTSVVYDNFQEAASSAVSSISDHSILVDIRKVTINLYDDLETEEV